MSRTIRHPDCRIFTLPERAVPSGQHAAVAKIKRRHPEGAASAIQRWVWPSFHWLTSLDRALARYRLDAEAAGLEVVGVDPITAGQIEHGTIAGVVEHGKTYRQRIFQTR